MGGVWKLIFSPQKPQNRRDKALNPQGPLGGTQRYTQLVRSPPWEGCSRCLSLTPWPLPCQGCLPGVPGAPRMETLIGDFQAQKNQVPGPCCPQEAPGT